MKRLQAYRFALRPDPDQERLFRQCGLGLSLRHQPGARPRDRPARRRGETLGLCRHGQPPPPVETGAADRLAGRPPLPDPPAGSQGPRPGLPELLREVGRVPDLPEEGAERRLPLPAGRPARRGHRPDLPPEGRVGPLPTEPDGPRNHQERHRPEIGRPLVRLDPVTNANDILFSCNNS